MLEMFFFGIVPGGLLLFAGKRIGQQQPPEQAARRVLALFLGVMLLACIGLLFIDIAGQVGGLVATIAMPVVAATIPIIYIHWRTSPTLHTRRIAFILLGCTAGAVLVAFLYRIRQGDILLPLVVGGGGLVTMVVWQAARARGWWRGLAWIGLGVLLGAAVIGAFVPNATIKTLPEWLQNGLMLLYQLVWPLAAIVLAGVLTHRCIVSNQYPLWKRAAGLVAIGLIGLMIMVQVSEAALLDRATDGMQMLAVSWFLGISAAAGTLMLAWTTNLRTLVVFGALAAVITLGTIAVVDDDYRHTTPQIVEGRAAQIDTAIQHYYAANGQYPSDLNALIPGYLLTIPNPVIFRNQTWCYEGGSDYYRLGYVSRPAFGVPAEMMRIAIPGSAGTPPSESWVCDQQLADFQAREAPLPYPPPNQ